MTTFIIGVGLGLFTGTCIGILAGALMHEAKREAPPISAPLSNVRVIHPQREHGNAS